jgi:hypothetical protein
VFAMPYILHLQTGTVAKPLLLPQNMSALSLKMSANYCFGKKERHLSLFNINNFYYY